MGTGKKVINLGFDICNIKSEDIPKVLLFLVKNTLELNGKVDKLLIAQKNVKINDGEDNGQKNQLDEIVKRLEKIELLASFNPNNHEQYEEFSKKLKLLEQQIIRKPDENGDYWMNVQEIIQYIPSHPAEATIYGWTMRKKIPFHKVGKKVQFRKSEIDAWMEDSRANSIVKTDSEIQAEAEEYIRKKKKEDQKKMMKKLL